MTRLEWVSREIRATQHLINGTLWTLTADQLHELITDTSLPAGIRASARLEWDAKADRDQR